MPRFAIWCLLPVLVVIGAVAEGQDIVAHRGASHDAPENTLPAFRLAWERNADGIEGDFHLTRDGHIVCFHDRTAERLTGVKREISEMTLDEIRALDIGRWKGAAWAGERVATLSEVLAIVPAHKFILIEIKCGPEIVPQLEKQLAAAHLKPAQTRVIAFDKRVVAAVKQRLPYLQVYWLVSYQRDKQTGQWSPRRDRVLTTLKEIGADGLDTNSNREVVDAAFARAIRACGKGLHVWTVDDLDDACYFQQLGVDSITTNRPGFLRQMLSSRRSAAPTGKKAEDRPPKQQTSPTGK